jgi:hypothetical protein
VFFQWVTADSNKKISCPAGATLAGRFAGEKLDGVAGNFPAGELIIAGIIASPSALRKKMSVNS